VTMYLRDMTLSCDEAAATKGHGENEEWWDY